MAETPAERARIVPHTQEAALLLEAVTILRLVENDLAAIRAHLKGAPVPCQTVAAKPKRPRAPRKAKAVQA